MMHIRQTSIIQETDKTKASVDSEIQTFINFLFGQFQTKVLTCQPVSSSYSNLMNYACDGFFIHFVSWLPFFAKHADTEGQ